jgi:hypothetical protein
MNFDLTNFEQYNKIELNLIELIKLIEFFTTHRDIQD